MKPLKSSTGFTLIELLVVIAVLGVLATGLIVLINPLGQMEKARDATRKSDLKQIASALEAFYINNGNYPTDWGGCDSSIGRASPNCPLSGSDWAATSGLQELISDGNLKILPIDPINNVTYHYVYEPENNSGPCSPSAGICRYWIGARLERPDDPALPIFRCTDRSDGTYTADCKETNGDQWGGFFP